MIAVVKFPPSAECRASRRVRRRLLDALGLSQKSIPAQLVDGTVVSQERVPLILARGAKGEEDIRG